MLIQLITLGYKTLKEKLNAGKEETIVIDINLEMLLLRITTKLQL